MGSDAKQLWNCPWDYYINVFDLKTRNYYGNVRKFVDIKWLILWKI